MNVMRTKHISLVRCCNIYVWYNLTRDGRRLLIFSSIFNTCVGSGRVILRTDYGLLSWGAKENKKTITKNKEGEMENKRGVTVRKWYLIAFSKHVDYRGKNWDYPIPTSLSGNSLEPIESKQAAVAAALNSPTPARRHGRPDNRHANSPLAVVAHVKSYEFPVVYYDNGLSECRSFFLFFPPTAFVSGRQSPVRVCKYVYSQLVTRWEGGLLFLFGAALYTHV